MTSTIAVFLGSVRPGREAEKVADWVIKALKKRGHKVYLIDPMEHKELQTLVTSYTYNPKPSKDLTQIHQWLLESDGFILLTPEYNNSFSGVIKNAIDNFYAEYEKKPFGVISYSIRPYGGILANRAIRSIIPELKGITTPASIIMPSVHELFDDSGVPKDPKYEGYLAAFIEDLEWYVTALKSARERNKKSTQ